MKDKIAHLMKIEGLTTSRLAEILEIQPSGISHLVSGRNKPSYDLLQKIMRRFPRINPDWLMLDSPQVYRDDATTPPLSGSDASHSSPIDLFGVDEVNGIQNLACESSGFADGRGQNLGGNSANFSAPNYGQNQPQNSPQSRADSEAAGVYVERVIIFYSDNSFRSYNVRR